MWHPGTRRAWPQDLDLQVGGMWDVEIHGFQVVLGGGWIVVFDTRIFLIMCIHSCISCRLKGWIDSDRYFFTINQKQHLDEQESWNSLMIDFHEMWIIPYSKVTFDVRFCFFHPAKFRDISPPHFQWTHPPTGGISEVWSYSNQLQAGSGSQLTLTGLLGFPGCFLWERWSRKPLAHGQSWLKFWGSSRV